jgi:hypothetical protein
MTRSLPKTNRQTKRAVRSWGNQSPSGRQRSSAPVTSNSYHPSQRGAALLGVPQQSP